jgi:hypothetical protein
MSRRDQYNRTMVRNALPALGDTGWLPAAQELLTSGLFTKQEAQAVCLAGLAMSRTSLEIQILGNLLEETALNMRRLNVPLKLLESRLAVI